MLAVGAASVASGAGELFHGGMPLSYVFVGALWGGLPGSLIAAILLAVEQFAVHVIADLGAVRAAGSIIFFIIAAIVGWTFDRLRDYDLARQVAEGQLAAEREAVAAHEARVTLVNSLHDSVLQTFHAIRMGADDPPDGRDMCGRLGVRYSDLPGRLHNPPDRRCATLRTGYTGGTFRTAATAPKGEFPWQCEGDR